MTIARLGIAAFSALTFSVPAVEAARAPVPEKLIAERAVAQQGLAIGLATIVLRSQAIAFAAAFFAVDNCSSLAGGGSWKLTEQTPTASGVEVRIKLYFDLACTNVYLDEKLAIEAISASPPTYKINATAQVFSKAGKKVGTLKIPNNILSAPTATSIKLVGVQTFDPAAAAAAELDMAISCELPRVPAPGDKTGLAKALLAPGDRDITCTAGVAQDFSVVKKAIASVFTVTLRVAGQGKGKVTFLQAAPAELRTGALGALSVKVSKAGKVSLKGASTKFGTTKFSGEASRLVLFPEKTVEWTTVDRVHDTRFSIELVSNATRNLTGGLSGQGGGVFFAPIKLDQSGTGTIEYSNGVKAAISSWVLAK